MALGYAQWKSGANQEVEQSFRKGVAVMRQCAAPASPAFVGTLVEYRTFLKAAGQGSDVAELDRELGRTRVERPPNCAACTVTAYGLLSTKK